MEILNSRKVYIPVEHVKGVGWVLILSANLKPLAYPSIEQLKEDASKFEGMNMVSVEVYESKELIPLDWVTSGKYKGD